MVYGKLRCVAKNKYDATIEVYLFLARIVSDGGAP